MSNSDLLIAQLQRRNRIMFGSMLGWVRGDCHRIWGGTCWTLQPSASPNRCPNTARTTNNRQANSASALAHPAHRPNHWRDRY